MSYAIKFALLILLPGTPAMDTGLSTDTRESCVTLAASFIHNEDKYWQGLRLLRGSVLKENYVKPRYSCVPTYREGEQ